MAPSRPSRAVYVPWHMPADLDNKLTCEREEMDIVDEPDMFLRVFESNNGQFPTDIDEKWKVSKVVTFGVIKDVLQAQAGYFSALCRTNVHKIKRGEIQDLAGPNTLAMEIWLRALHHTINDKCYEATVDDTWSMMAVSHYYDFNERLMAPFFDKWYPLALARVPSDLERGQSLDAKKLDFHRLAIAPAYRFFAKSSFAKITRYITYHSEKHVEDLYPATHSHLRAPFQVMRQVNAARGHLRNLISKTLNNPIRGLVNNERCTCSALTVLRYLKALSRAHLWPVDEIWKDTSAVSAITRLSVFQYQPPPQSCFLCKRPDYTNHIRDRAAQISAGFDGLCIDCMESSKPTEINPDHKAWFDDHLRSLGWDVGCEIRHGESTFYYSYSGRGEDRERILKSKRKHCYDFSDSD